MNQVEFIEYRPELARYFTELNLAWVEKYFVVEALDKEVLGDPENNIIRRGGYIYFALYDGTVAGTFALLNKQGGVYELAKMAVSEHFQGKHIGNLMLAFCISKAKALNIKKLILFSNTILKPAIHLYRKYGFTEVPLGDSEYTRSNIKMELAIS
jgi:ribosomal protein S18 acetylase RimI-like enzyme